MLMRSIHINGSNHCDTELSMCRAAPGREADTGVVTQLRSSFDQGGFSDFLFGLFRRVIFLPLVCLFVFGAVSCFFVSRWLCSLVGHRKLLSYTWEPKFVTVYRHHLGILHVSPAQVFGLRCELVNIIQHAYGTRCFSCINAQHPEQMRSDELN